MRALTGVLAAAALGLAGCDSLSLDADAKARAALAGIWFSVSEETGKAPDEALTVHSWLTLYPDGQFYERLRGLYPDGRIVEAGSKGEWLVTGNLFKLRYAAINGENLRRHDVNTMRAFTLVSMKGDEFSYASPFSSKAEPLKLRRVPEAGKEP